MLRHPIATIVWSKEQPKTDKDKNVYTRFGLLGLYFLNCKWCIPIKNVQKHTHNHMKVSFPMMPRVPWQITFVVLIVFKQCNLWFILLFFSSLLFKYFWGKKKCQVVHLSSYADSTVLRKVMLYFVNIALCWPSYGNYVVLKGCQDLWWYSKSNRWY